MDRKTKRFLKWVTLAGFAVALLLYAEGCKRKSPAATPPTTTQPETQAKPAEPPDKDEMPKAAHEPPAQEAKPTPVTLKKWLEDKEVVALVSNDSNSL